MNIAWHLYIRIQHGFITPKLFEKGAGMSFQGRNLPFSLGKLAAGQTALQKVQEPVYGPW